MACSVPYSQDLNESYFLNKTVNRVNKGINVDSLHGGRRRLKRFHEKKHFSKWPSVSFKMMCFRSGCRFWWNGSGVMWPCGPFPRRQRETVPRMKRPQLRSQRSKSCTSATTSFHLDLVSELVVKQGGAACTTTHDVRARVCGCI